jgi:hypothetical protein
MKTLKFITLFLLAIAFGSCNDTDGTTDNSEQVLLGTWKMVKAYGGISGVVHNIPEGTITWTFDTDSNTLTVVNNNMDTTLDAGLDSGTYSYQIVNSEAPESCSKTLMIDGNDYGCFIKTEAGLTISQVYADGLIYDFVE